MIIEALDKVLMLLYRHVGKNSRRLVRLAAASLPLMALLVGSCKTAQLPLAYGQSGAEQFRTALFPDRAGFRNAGYRPAAGYVSQARTFVADQPQSLMMLTQQEIGFLFGKPTLRRHDADAEVWQYKAGGCVVDFYFYNEGARGQSPLAHLDFRMKDELIPGSPAREQPVSAGEQTDCLRGVMSRGSFGISI